MRISRDLLKNRDFLAEKGISALPFPVAEQARKDSLKNPRWMHIGPGNLFRAFLAEIAEDLIASGDTDCGIISVKTRGRDGYVDIFDRNEGLSLAVYLLPDGSAEKKLLSSIVDMKCTDESFDTILKKAASASLQLISFTVTEKGYVLTGPDGNFTEDALHDISCTDDVPLTVPGTAARLLYSRFISGMQPVALVSMDNCSSNGDVLKRSVMSVALQWVKKGLADDRFIDYISDPGRVSFPITMIDKITPSPSAETLKYLPEFSEIRILNTEKGSKYADFVNCEKPGYLVIEDSFPNGRPQFEKASVIMTDRDTVKKCESMKVSSCLNPVHTALALAGCLLGYTRIYKEMENRALRSFAKAVAYECIPAVDDPKVISPAEFLDVVLEKRLPNPAIPDSPQRIASDTSQKIPVRFGPAIKYHLGRGSAESLEAIPFVIALWFRYLTGIDDIHGSFELSPDPRMQELKLDASSGFDDVLPKIRKIISDDSIFGTDLSGTVMERKILSFFLETEETGMIEANLRSFIR